MVSAFIVMGVSSTSIFELNEEEWQHALQLYPELKNEDEIMNFYPKSANSFIEPKKDNYFNNDVILRQFERLFKLLKSKSSFNDHDIEIIVDNARTHSTKLYDINKLGKSPGTKCPYETIEWNEDGENKIIHCFDHSGKSKGLFAIAKELKLLPDDAISSSIYLDQLRALVASHKAFETWTKLQKLADEYGVKIIFCPKYHCELNPIEGLWCASKQYVRKYNDQSFDNLNNLITQSFEEYKRSNLNIKLWARFWNALEMYNRNASYKDVMQTLFGAKHSEKINGHRKNTHINTNLT